MPIYEFVCEACGRLSEVMQKMSDPPPAACPECGEGRLARMVSRTSFQLKGGGWYSDLYASPREKPKPGATADGGSAPPASSPAATTSTPSTPAATTASPAATPTAPAPAKGKAKGKGDPGGSSGSGSSGSTGGGAAGA